MAENKTELGGFKEIQECCARLGLPSSQASVLDMINFQGLPARKIGGTWIADAELITKWRKEYIEGRPVAGKQQQTKSKGRFLGGK